LIAQQVRHRDPEQASHDHEVGQNGDEERLVSGRRKAASRSGSAAADTKCPVRGRQKFIDKFQDEKESDRENNKERRRKFENSPISIVAGARSSRSNRP
jgi:hypothetical protein